MSKSPCIAIIDDGINPLFFHIWPLLSDVEISYSLKVRKVKKHSPHVLNHATVCAGIIKKYLPQANICSIKVLNENLKGSVAQTVKGIEWCIANNIKLINMSIGTTCSEDFNHISLIVEKAYNNGIIIVAASNNNNKITYPACLDKVIGVRCCPPKILGDGEFYYNSNDPKGIEITCNGSHCLKGPDDQTYITGPSNSFAAPYVTTIVYSIIQDNSKASIENINEILKQNAFSSL